MQPSSMILAKIKSFESCVLHVYLDSADYPTIGYGSRFYENGQEVQVRDENITQERADLLFSIAVSKVVDWINKTIPVKLNQNQFDACVDFFYNIGTGGFITRYPHTWLHLSTNKLDEFAKDLLMFTRARGKILKGLKVRRQFDYDLFLTPIT